MVCVYMRRRRRGVSNRFSREKKRVNADVLARKGLKPRERPVNGKG